MTLFLRPSDGAVRQGGHIDLNIRGFKAGDRVLFEAEFGHPRIDIVDRMDGNDAIIDGTPVLVTKLSGRIPAALAAEDEAALLGELKRCFAGGAHLYQEARKPILRKWEVR
jgi:hypothetical protein